MRAFKKWERRVTAIVDRAIDTMVGEYKWYEKNEGNTISKKPSYWRYRYYLHGIADFCTRTLEIKCSDSKEVVSQMDIVSAINDNEVCKIKEVFHKMIGEMSSVLFSEEGGRRL